MKGKLGCGCLGITALTVFASFALAGTELGKWLIGLVMIYGVAPVFVTMAHDVVPGEVVELKRLPEPTSYSAGSLTFSYVNADGVKRTESRPVMYPTPKFRGLEVGDPVDVWICKNDPAKVMLVGYGTYEAETCGGRSKAVKH